MNEIWKDIKGYEGLYQVSNLGQAKTDTTYCVCDEKECFNTNECERHQNRYNFDKTRNYSFCKFNSNECLKE